MTLSEAARAVSLPLSTVSRLLGTLESSDFVRRLSDGRYVPGGRLLKVGVLALHGLDLYDMSAPYLEQLADQTGETANLGIPTADDQVLYIRQSLSKHSIRHAAWIGRSVPIEGTAIGAAISGRFGRNGVSLARVTLEPDVTALAAPIFGADDLIVGALSVTGPSYRMDDALIDRAKIALLQAVHSLSLSLGASEAKPSDGRRRVQSKIELPTIEGLT
ncbi:IclR family transcriptional regulator [Lichenihabitans psoromatis]|nr:IclR family transcriptional regulator [Lichenihabitans psoromatis]